MAKVVCHKAGETELNAISAIAAVVIKIRTSEPNEVGAHVVASYLNGLGSLT